jgi:hypothetical protein
MDFLRQLFPGHTEPPSAARLDVPPRFASLRIPVEANLPPGTPAAQAATRPPATPAGQSHGAHVDSHVADPMPQSGPPPHPPRPRLPAHESQVAQPAGLDTPPRVPALPTPTSPAPLASRLSNPVPPARTGGAPIAREPAAIAMPAAPTPQSIASAPTLSPLREEALRERAQPPRAEPAPIVHVTIDRIDVRLPAPPVPLPSPRRARPASGVPPLADYLRGRSGSGA